MKSVKRVKTKKELDEFVEDREAEGFKLESMTDRQAILIRRNIGGLVGHFIIFLLTVWWTFFLGNILYAVYRHFGKGEELIIKVEGK